MKPNKLTTIRCGMVVVAEAAQRELVAGSAGAEVVASVGLLPPGVTKLEPV
jgi:hypothetical protein